MSNQSFLPRGGVDLAALAAAKEAAAQAAASRASAPAGVIVEVTEDNFETLVLQQSMTVPVVVDLWATWCEPCKQLSPVLEKLVAEAGGRLVLATVDVDAQPRIAAAFRVQSIPTVVAVVGGQPLPLFQGAVPESQVKAYLGELLKAAEEAGVSGVVGEAPLADEPIADVVEEDLGDPRLDDAADAIERGDWAAAIAAYEAILTDSPADEWAKAGLSQVRLMERTEGRDLPAAVAAAAADPSDVPSATLAADALVLAGDPASAFAVLVETVRLTDGTDRATARQHLLDLFDLVGADNPAVAPARVALANALF